MFVLKGLKGPVQSVAFCGAHRRLLTVSAYATQVWDLDRRALTWAMQPDNVYQACFTPGGRSVLTTKLYGNSTPGLRDAETGAPLELPVSLAVARGLKDPTFSPDGSQLVAVEFPRNYGLRWWQWPGGEPLPFPETDTRYRGFGALAFRPDGTLLAAMSPQGVRLHEAATGREFRLLPFPIVQSEYRLAFSPDGRQLAMASGTRLSVVEVDTGEEVASLRQERKFFLQLAFTPDGRHLATVSNEETTKFWDTATWRLAAEFAWQVGGLRCLAFSPDGMLAAAGGTGRKVVVWDVDL